MDTHILPHIACFSCGKRIGALNSEFERLVSEGMTKGEALDVLGVTRTCCRTNMLSPAAIPLGAGVKLREEQKAIRIAAPVEALKQGTPRVTSTPRMTHSPAITPIPKPRQSPIPRRIF